MKMKIISTFLISICLLNIFSAQFLHNLKLNGLEKNEEIHWAVLVAGSNSFFNYRHQSDIFHSYQVLIKKGLSPNNIIVMAYDDIANSSENPFRGKVFNKPDPNGKGVDVYENVKIDYRGEDVNAQNFLNVITGNKKGIKGGNGRVLESQKTDNVFIYFSDHGAVGLVAFPSTQLYADKLNNAIEEMHKSNMYKKLVFYLEACESGSMFNKSLKKDIKVYATTAANPNESSWATYCEPDDKINGKSIGSCLADEYSANWIENAEAKSANQEETLSEQFDIVKKKTTHSHVQKYGDFSYVNETIDDFEGYDQNNSDSLWQRILKYLTEKVCRFREIINIPCKEENFNSNNPSYLKYLEKAKNSAIDSRKTKVDYLLRKAETTNDPKYQEMLRKEIEHMENTNKIFEDFDTIFNINRKENVDEIDIEYNCLRNSVEAYKKCNEFGEYDLIFVRNIAMACDKNPSEDVTQFFRNLC